MSLHKHAELDSIRGLIDSLTGMLGDSSKFSASDDLGDLVPVDEEDDVVPTESLDDPRISVVSVDDEDDIPSSEDLGLGTRLPGEEELEGEEDPDTLKALIRARLRR